ncbi:MAG: hypothetical protein K8963_06050 [Proteobacteria bacterium]|nr:hypothetical protein [Pseudomonadota bacterium]
MSRCEPSTLHASTVGLTILKGINLNQSWVLSDALDMSARQSPGDGRDAANTGRCQPPHKVATAIRAATAQYCPLQ